jgi:hypothetical protein
MTWGRPRGRSGLSGRTDLVSDVTIEPYEISGQVRYMVRRPPFLNVSAGALSFTADQLWELAEMIPDALRDTREPL